MSFLAAPALIGAGGVTAATAGTAFTASAFAAPAFGIGPMLPAAWAPAAAAGAGFGLSDMFGLFGSIGDLFGSGDNGAAWAEYNAAVARNNQAIAMQDAADAIARGEVEAEDHRKRVAATRGAARAVLAANGILVDDDDESTASLIQQDIAEAGELDILRIRNNASREQRQHNIRAMNFDAQARGHQMQANQARDAAGAAAFGTLLGAAGKIGGKLLTRTKPAALRTPMLPVFT